MAEHQNAGAVAVRLGAVAPATWSRLDGFKSRSLRATGAAASVPRNQYITEWRSNDSVVDERVSAMLVLTTSERGRFASTKPAAEPARKQAIFFFFLYGILYFVF